MQGRSEMRCKMLGRVKVLMSGLDPMCVLRREKNGPAPSHRELDESIFHSFQPSFSSSPKSHLQTPEPFCQVIYIYIYIFFFYYQEYPQETQAFIGNCKQQALKQSIRCLFPHWKRVVGVLLVSHLPITCYKRQNDQEFGDTAVRCINMGLFGVCFDWLVFFPILNMFNLSSVTKK